MSHLSSRRHGRGKKCLHFWGQIATQVAKYVAEPILAPESRFRGIRWGNLHHFSRSIRSDRSRGSGEGSEMKIFPWCLKCQLLQRERLAIGNLRPNGSAADLPFGDGPIDLWGVAGVAGPKTWIFDALRPGWPSGSPGRSEPYAVRRSAPF